MEQREERRLEAARLFRRGKLSQAEIARRMGVSPGAVSQWYAAWQTGGDQDLRARPRTGRKARLNARQWEKLGHVLERGPMAAGFDSPRWTLQRIAALIEDRFGVVYHPRYLERPLRARGFALREQQEWASLGRAGAGVGSRASGRGTSGRAGAAPGRADRSRAARGRPQSAAASRRTGGRESSSSGSSRSGSAPMRVSPSLLRSQSRQGQGRRAMH